MQNQTAVSQQLCFSIGRPLAILLEEIENSTQNSELVKAAEQMRQALKTFTVAERDSWAMSVAARDALYELLTK